MKSASRFFLLLCLGILVSAAWAVDPGDVVINEIMYDDIGTPTDMEWVEIHNTTDSPIDISGWYLTDNNAYPTSTEGGIEVPASTTIPADGYLVLCKVALDDIDGEIVCSEFDASWTLGNSGDNLALYTSTSGGTLIDGIISADENDYYPDLAGSNDGESIEKCNENAPWSSDSEYWHVSTNEYATTGLYRFCTPGAANTTCGPVQDTDPPLLSFVWVNTTTQIDVRFNEVMDETTTETVTNYSVNNGVGNPSTAELDGTDARIVHLTFGSALAANAYELTVSSVEDTAGNPIVTDFRPFVISTVAIGTDDIVISEVMYDNVDTDVEWVEIYNTTGSTIDISGLLLSDATEYPPFSEGVIQVPNGTSLAAGQYLVLGLEDLADITGEVICGSLYGSFALSNDPGDNLVLLHPVGGALIHGSFTTLYPDLATANAGNSIEVCSNTLGNDWDTIEWYESAAAYASTVYVNCTPGSAPSPCDVDITPPEIVTISVLSTTAIDVLFNEDLDETTAETVGNYDVTPGNVTPATATLDGTNLALVHLTFTSPFAEDTYTLTVNGVEDLAENACVDETDQFTISSYIPEYGDILITEVMYNDTGTGGAPLGDREWVELYNATTEAINLSGWVLSDDDVYPAAGEGVVEIPAATVLAAGAYLVLGWHTDVLVEIPSAIIGTTVYGSLALGNSGDNLTLYTAQTGGIFIYGSLTQNFPNGTTVPGYSIEVCLDDFGQDWDTIDWYQSDTIYNTEGRYLNCTPGSAPHTCEQDVTPPVLLSAALANEFAVDAFFDEALDITTSETAANYSIDNGFGTPDSANLLTNNMTVRLYYPTAFTPPNTYTLTVNNVEDLAENVIAANSTAQFTVTEAVDIIITEIMPNPAAVFDNLGEWFEIYNNEETAVDLTGWRITDQTGSDTIEVTLSIPSHEYMVFCNNGDFATNGGIDEDYVFFGGATGVTLNNTGMPVTDVISLFDASNNLVTSLTYNTTFPYLAGYSMQLRDLTYPVNEDTSWCLPDDQWIGSAGDFGTPGATNVCAGPSIPTELTLCEIRTIDVCGTSLENGVHALTYGVVTHVDVCRRNVYVEDDGCAVLVYGNSCTNNMQNETRPPAVGDSVSIEGNVTAYNGLIEFSDNTPIPVVITYLAASVAPADEPVLTVADVDIHLDDCTVDAYESRHVMLENVVFPQGDGINTFATADSNYWVISGTDTTIFRVDDCSDLVGELIPDGPINLHGVLGQYDYSSCYCSGWQIQSGRHEPFTSTEIPCTVPVDVTNFFNTATGYVDLRWSPGLGQLCDCYRIYYTTDGNASFPEDFTFLDCVCSVTEYTDTNPLAAIRFYVVVATESCP
ncbi:lamin tail domain-containing protein [bacterium]|nr:lamin tail domain-containing protein [bacterium]